jgi:hypothetical protein
LVSRSGGYKKRRAFLVHTLLASVFFHLSYVYLPSERDLKVIRSRFFKFIWGSGKPEVLARKVLEVSADNGGLGVIRLGDKLRSVFLHVNLCRMAEGSLGLGNPRFLLFRYNFSERVRDIYPVFYNLSDPHCLQLTPAYRQLLAVFLRVKARVSAAAPLVPLPRQIYEWLGDGERRLDLVNPPGPWDDAVTGRIYAALNFGKVPTLVSDFIWRSVRGALKTGDFVARFKWPNLKTHCMFCNVETETVCHLYLFCRILKPVRSRLLDIAHSSAGRTTPERDILFLVTGLSPSPVNKEMQIFLTTVVGSVNRAIWLTRNDLLFSREERFSPSSFMYQLEEIVRTSTNDSG